MAIIAAVVVWAGCTSTTAYRGQSRPDEWATLIEKPGLDNFYKVSDAFYRGEQPTAEGFAQLKRMGIKTVVNLRDIETDDRVSVDNQISTEYIPMRASNPKEEDVVKFLKIVTDDTKTPVFIHCKRGADRTGFICAAYRVAVCGWSKPDAIDEMLHGGYRFSPLCLDLTDFINGLDVEKLRKDAGIKYSN
jgi:protein tyrosine/serine phosphatase